MANPQFVNPAGNDLTPESMFEQKVKAGRDGIQQEFQREWDTINQQAKINRFSPQKHQQLLADASARAQDRAAKFDQMYQTTVSDFKNSDQLEQQGVITSSAEAKWRKVLGPEAERLMPKPQVDPIKQHEELTDQYDKLLKYKAEKFRVYDAWFDKPRLEIRRDPYTDKWDSKLTTQERKLAMDIDNTLNELSIKRDMSLRPNLSGLGNTAINSNKIKGGSIKDQTKELIEQRQGNAQQGGGQQGQEDLSQLSDEELKRIAGGM